MYLKLTIQPNSPKTQLGGYLGDTLKIKISAPPTKDKANKELIKFLSKLFKTEVIITKGHKSKHKTIFIKEDTQVNEIISNNLPK